MRLTSLHSVVTVLWIIVVVELKLFCDDLAGEPFPFQLSFWEAFPTQHLGFR